jgi:hypothetical protein
LDKPLQVTLNKSKLAYVIYVILIANKEFKKYIYDTGEKVGRKETTRKTKTYMDG